MCLPTIAPNARKIIEVAGLRILSEIVSVEALLRQKRCHYILDLGIIPPTLH